MNGVSLRTRLVILVVVVSAVATMLSVWLVARSAEQAMREQSRRTLDDTAEIYRQLATAGANATDWNAVGPEVQELSEQYDVRIALTDEDGRPLVDSDVLAGDPPRALPEVPIATIDPVTPSVMVVEPTFEPEVVDEVTRCLDEKGIDYQRGGEGDLPFPKSEEGGKEYLECVETYVPQLRMPDQGELRECLHRAGFKTRTKDGVVIPRKPSRPALDAMTDCDEQLRRETSAPVAQLYLGTAAGLDAPLAGLDPRQLAGIVVAILGFALVAAWWFGRVLTKPLTSLAAAAGELERGDLGSAWPTPVTTRSVAPAGPSTPWPQRWSAMRSNADGWSPTSPTSSAIRW